MTEHPTREQTEQRWTAAAAKLLVGRTIVAVRYLTDAEASEADWGNRPIALQLDNGLLVYPMCDDEGNDGGALGTSDGEASGLPTLSVGR